MWFLLSSMLDFFGGNLSVFTHERVSQLIKTFSASGRNVQNICVGKMLTSSSAPILHLQSKHHSIHTLTPLCL